MRDRSLVLHMEREKSTRGPLGLDLNRVFLEDHSRVELYDQLLIPALASCRHDRNRRRISKRDQKFVFEAVRIFVEHTDALAPKKEPEAGAAPANAPALANGRPTSTTSSTIR